MSKFFTYEDRLELQKGLKEGLSLKAITRTLGKNPTTIARKIKSISLKLPQGIQGFHLMNAGIGLTATKRIFFVPIAGFAVTAMSTARILYAKPALHVPGHPMCAMAVKQSASVH